MIDDDLTSELQPMTEAGAIIEAIRAAQPPVELEIGTVYLTTDGSGERRIVDTDGYSDRPRRVTRAVFVDDVASLVSYVNEMVPEGDLSEAPEIWADQAAGRIVAVLDPPIDVGLPGWCSHRATYELKHTPEWERWTAGSGKLGSQVDFAELIEDRALDIVTPEPTVMLELAQSFEARAKVDFQSAEWLASGQRALNYSETVEAKAGRKGAIVIPATFDLALRPYWGCPQYRVTARLRYRIDGGSLRIGYKLMDPDRVLEAAFADVIGQVEVGLTAGAVRRGRP